MQSLNQDKLKHLYALFQATLPAESDSSTQGTPTMSFPTDAANQFARLLLRKPIYESDRIAVYTHHDAIAAGFTRAQAIDHVGDLFLNYNNHNSR